jgi:hypothetical protein
MRDRPVKYHLRLGCTVLAPERDRLRLLRGPFEVQREAKHCVLHELARALVMAKHLGARGDVSAALNQQPRHRQVNVRELRVGAEDAGKTYAGTSTYDEEERGSGIAMPSSLRPLK